MGMRRAQKHAMQRAGLKKISDEASLTEQEPAVFQAAKRRANALPPPSRSLTSGGGEGGSAVLRVGPDYCNSSRTRSRRSKADLSVTMNKSASPPLASCRAQVQCGMVKTSC